MTEKNSYYTSHDFNARNDESILQLRMLHGYEGYGLYWALIEIMGESTDYHCSSNAVATLAFGLSVAEPLLKKVIDSCLDSGLFQSDGEGHFFSQALRDRMETFEQKRRKRVEAGRKGGNATAMLKQSSGNAVAIERVERGKKIKKKEIPKTEYSDVCKMTEEQYRKLVNEFGSDGTKTIIEMLSNYKRSNGKTYKCDYSAIRNWVVAKYKKEHTNGSSREVDTEKYARIAKRHGIGTDEV